LFFEQFSTTKAKINQLFDESGLIDVYYKYQDSNTAYKTCFLKRANETTFLYSGEPEANITHTLTFLESS